MFNIIFMIPIILAALVILLKMKFIKKSDEKGAIKEFIADLLRFIFVYVVLISANIFFDIDYLSISTMIIDFILLITALFAIITKNDDYPNRKALLAIVAYTLLLGVIATMILKMLLGIFESGFIGTFLKLAAVLIFSGWNAVTFDSKNKFKTIREIFKNYTMTRRDYLVISIFAMFALVGDPYGYLAPPLIAVFGIQDILRGKFIKGISYIIVGTFILYLDYSQTLILVYSLIGMIDIFLTAVKFNKNSLKKKVVELAVKED